MAAIAAPVLYALVINLGALSLPPALDSSVTVAPAALTIVELDFDIWAVAQLPSSPEGGPSTHATSLYTILLAGLISLLGPTNAFVAAHVLSILLIGGLTSATYLLSRQRSSRLVSALAALTVGVVPLVVQQAADIYLDLPLAVVSAFALWSALRRRFWLTSGLVLLGVALKTSAVFLLPLILIAKPIEWSTRRHLIRALIAGAICSIPLLIVLATTHRFSGGVTSEARFVLSRSALALLVLTVDVFALLALYGMAIYGRLRAGRLDRFSLASLLFVVAFWAVHMATMLLSGTITMLPRYYIAVLPATVAAVLPAELSGGRWHRLSSGTALGFVVLLALFSLANVTGDLYPRPSDDFYVITERSTRAQQLLELHVAGTRRLADVGLPILAERQVYFRLLYPEMGYVSHTPDNVIPILLNSPRSLPDTFAMLIERRYANPLLPIEEAAEARGYELNYEELVVGPFRSQLVTATRPG